MLEIEFHLLDDGVTYEVGPSMRLRRNVQSIGNTSSILLLDRNNDRAYSLSGTGLPVVLSCRFDNIPVLFRVPCGSSRLISRLVPTGFLCRRPKYIRPPCTLMARYGFCISFLYVQTLCYSFFINPSSSKIFLYWQ